MRKNNFLYMLSFMKHYTIPYFVGLIIISSYYLITDAFTGKIYSMIITVSDISDVFRESVKILTYIITIMLLSALGMVLFNQAIAYANRNIRRAIVHAFEYMSMGEYAKKHSGNWLTVFNKDADRAMDAYRQQARRILSAVISSVGGICILSTQSIKFMLFTIAIGLSCMLLGISRKKPMERVSKLLRNTVQNIAVQMSNILQGNNEIKFFQMGHLIKKWIQESLNHLKQHNKKLTQIQTWCGALSQLGTAICYSSSLIFGLYLVTIGDLSLTNMMQCWPITLGAALGFQEFGFFSVDFQPISVSICRIRELLSVSEERGGEEKEADLSKKPIAIKDVSFSYGDKEVLSNINFEVQSGEKVAVVGKSGSGKSTLIKLLLRMYDVEKGSIEIFGRNIASYDLQFLRSLFSYVPQDANILSGSIYENIRLGDALASKDSLIEAAISAGANEFIEKTPDGYETIIGNSGMKLSGGERQRIAMARAFLKNGPIFLLDEVSSALDNLNESKLISCLSDSKQTMLIITHRPAILSIADKVITIENGKIVSVFIRNNLKDC